MLNATSKTIRVPITSTATVTESYSSQCLPSTRMTPPDVRNSRGRPLRRPPCAASVVQRDRSRTKPTVAADRFSRVSIRFRGPAFRFHGPAFVYTNGRAGLTRATAQEATAANRQFDAGQLSGGRTNRSGVHRNLQCVCIAVCRRASPYFPNALRDISVFVALGGHPLRSPASA
jgi:hypothetical protein